MSKGVRLYIHGGSRWPRTRLSYPTVYQGLSALATWLSTGCMRVSATGCEEGAIALHLMPRG